MHATRERTKRGLSPTRAADPRTRRAAAPPMQPAPALETLSQPVTLACGHNFEHRFLHDRLRSGEKNCPTCSTPVGLRAEQLKVNQDVQRLIWHLARQPRIAERGPSVAAPALRPPLAITTCAPTGLAAASSSPLGRTVTSPATGFPGAMATNPVAHQWCDDYEIVESKKGLTEPSPSAGTSGDADNSIAAALITAAGSSKAYLPVKLCELRLGRNTEEVIGHMKACFAHQLAALTASTSAPTCELPVTTTKRVMKQDAVDASARLISEDALRMMTFAIEIFVGFVVYLAWHSSTHPHRRNTLDHRDLQRAVAATSSLDFLLITVGGLLDNEQQPVTCNEKQAARMLAFRKEKMSAARWGLEDAGARVSSSRRKHAMRRQRGLRGRFLGRGEVDAVACLTGGAMAASPGPGIPATTTETEPVANAAEIVDEPAPPAAQLGSFREDDAPDADTAPLRAVASAPPQQLGHVSQPLPVAVRSNSDGQPRSYTRLPLANVARVMNRNLPAGVRISQEAKECMCDLAGEWAALVTMEASCWHAHSSKAVTPTTLLHALTRLDLDGLVPTLRVWAERYGKSKPPPGVVGSGDSVSAVQSMGLLGAASIIDSAAEITSILFDGEGSADEDGGDEVDDEGSEVLSNDEERDAEDDREEQFERGSKRKRGKA